MKTIPLIRNNPIDHRSTIPVPIKQIASAPLLSAKIALPTSKGLEFIHSADIIYVRSAGNYIQVYTVQRNDLFVNKMISRFENQVSPSTFVRIHHQYLINIQHLTRYEKGDGGTVYLTNDIALPVSREKKKQFLKKVCGSGCEEY